MTIKIHVTKTNRLTTLERPDQDVVLPAFRHAVKTSRFREHPEGGCFAVVEAGSDSNPQIGVPGWYPETKRNEDRAPR